MGLLLLVFLSFCHRQNLLSFTDIIYRNSLTKGFRTRMPMCLEPWMLESLSAVTFSVLLTRPLRSVILRQRPAASSSWRVCVVSFTFSSQRLTLCLGVGRWHVFVPEQLTVISGVFLRLTPQTTSWRDVAVVADTHTHIHKHLIHKCLSTSARTGCVYVLFFSVKAHQLLIL